MRDNSRAAPGPFRPLTPSGGTARQANEAWVDLYITCPEIQPLPDRHPFRALPEWMRPIWIADHDH